MALGILKFVTAGGLGGKRLGDGSLASQILLGRGMVREKMAAKCRHFNGYAARYWLDRDSGECSIPTATQTTPRTHAHTALILPPTHISHFFVRRAVPSAFLQHG